MSLNRDFNFIIGNGFTLRSVEIVGFSAAARRRTAASVEENDFYIVFVGNFRELFFGFVDLPVGFQIAAVFGSVGKAQHDCL